MNDAKKQRYKAWMHQVEQWANIHGISIHSAISIISNDSAYDKDNPDKEKVTLRSLFWEEADEFAGEYFRGHLKARRERKQHYE